MASKRKVYFFFDEVSVSLRNRAELKRIIELIFKREKRSLYCLKYIFCSDKKLLEVNRHYLRHDYYTDVITFDLSDKGQGIRGEIYISTERVKENALNLKETFISELHRVIFHGALHLCGYGDKGRVEQEKMRRAEDFYLAQLN